MLLVKMPLEDVQSPFFGGMIAQRVFRDTYRARQALIKAFTPACLGERRDFDPICVRIPVTMTR